MTQVRFDEALHEFTTLDRGQGGRHRHHLEPEGPAGPGARATSRSTLRLDERGPGDATAVDLQLTGRRRDPQPRPAHRHAQRQGPPGRRRDRRARARATSRPTSNKRSSTIGVIPIDSIFSPVRRVTFDIEPVRVEQSTDFDRLVLDIETDGTITPARGAGLGRRHAAQPGLDLVADLDEAPQGLELGDVGTHHQRLARPRPAHRGARPLRAPAQLPQARRRSTRSASWSTRTMRRPAGDHQLRPEVADEVVQRLDERGLSLRTKD